MYLGIDIGGSKIILAVFDTNGAIREEKQLQTPKKYEDFVKFLAQEINKLSHKNFHIASVAVPGRLERKSGIGLGFGSLRWQNVPIKKDLQNAIPNSPVVIENDVKIAALHEAILLELTQERVIYFTISNGIGGGVVINGEVDKTMQDSEFGSMVFPFEGSWIRWEDFASGRAIVERFGTKMAAINDKDTLKTIAEDIIIGVIASCSGIQADTVIFGGGAGGNLAKCLPYMEQFLDKYLVPTIKRPRLLIAKDPKRATILGTYLLAKRSEQKNNNE